MSNNTTVWVTGASSGIGEALALNWAKRGATVFISSRKKEGLEAVKQKASSYSGKVVIEIIDLENQETVSLATDNILKQVDSLDYIFLNGGFSQRSYIEDTDLEMDRRMMEVNYFGNVSITKKILPFLIKQGHGHFIITSSLTGVFGIPLRSSYAASKHALHGFYDTLRAEQKSNKINVTIACPGFIRTDISKNALGADGNPTGKMDDAQNKGMLPSKCAQKMISAALSNKKEIYIGRKELLMVYFKRFLPFIYYFLASRVKPN